MFTQQSAPDRILKAILNDQGHLFMAYQPKINLSTMRIDSFEALLRWRENGGYVNPEVILNAALQAGDYIADCLLSRITEKVISDIALVNESMRHPVSINLNPAQLSHSYLEYLLGVAESYGVSKRLLELEVTEHHPFGELDSFRERVEQTQEAGVNVWLDDFGHGYSSLSMLAGVGVHGVKLDSSFAKNCRSELGGSLFESVVNMCQKLGFKVVVEGVEGRHEHQLAVDCNCDYGQGYFYGRPEVVQMDLHTWFKKEKKNLGAAESFSDLVLAEAAR